MCGNDLRSKKVLKSEGLWLEKTVEVGTLSLGYQLHLTQRERSDGFKVIRALRDFCYNRSLLIIYFMHITLYMLTS